MEMERDPVRENVELQVVYVVEPALSHESESTLSALEFSSTSYPGNSSNSSPESPHITISISPQNLSDQTFPGAAEGNLSASARARRTPFLPRAQAMRSLQESTAHSIILQRLKSSEKGHRKEASEYKKQVRRLVKDMYVIVSMYAVLQGVLFVAVAQSTAFRCEDRWGPAGIAGGVMIGAVCSVVDKLRRMGDLKRKAKRSEKCQNAVYDKIELLYSCGSGCPIDGNLDPQISKQLPCNPPALLCPRGLLVLGFLVAFSLLIIASCTSMICYTNAPL